MKTKRFSVKTIFLSQAKTQRTRKSGIYNGSDARTVRTKFSMDPSAYRYQSSRSRTAFDQLSSITDFQRVQLTRQMTLSAADSDAIKQNTTPKRRILTKKSLKEFEKTPQGK